MTPHLTVVDQAEDRRRIPPSAASDAQFLGAVTAMLSYRRRELAERRTRESGYRSIERELWALRRHAPRAERLSTVGHGPDSPVSFVTDTLVLLSASLDARLGLSGECDVHAETLRAVGDRC